jgi:hypothetical protein
LVKEKESKDKENTGSGGEADPRRPVDTREDVDVSDSTGARANEPLRSRELREIEPGLAEEQEYHLEATGYEERLCGKLSDNPYLLR